MRSNRRHQRNPFSVQWLAASLQNIALLLGSVMLMVWISSSETIEYSLQLPGSGSVMHYDKGTMIDNLYVGHRASDCMDDSYYLVAEGMSMDLEDIEKWKWSCSDNSYHAGSHGQTITVLYIDKRVSMGVVSQIQQELRKAGAFQVVYASN